MPDTIPVLDLLEYGLPGFAVILFGMGYRLLNKFQSELLAVDMNQFSSPKMFENWAEMAESLVFNARIFLLVSVLFFAGGLAMAIIDPSSKIILSISPPEGVQPEIKLQEELQPLDGEGKVKLSVKEEHVVRILNHPLVTEMNDLKRQVEDVQSQFRQYVADTEARALGVGF